MKHIKTFENYSELSDSEIINQVTNIGNELLNRKLIEATDFDVRNEGVNGITLTFNKEKPNKLFFFNYKYQDLGLCLVDVKNQNKVYHQNDTHSYNTNKLPIDNLEFEDYPNYLV
jgi:hypothetical protein